MSTLNVYSYYDATGFRKYADFDDVAFTGTWSSTGTYYLSASQVVNYGQSQYIAITDNIGKNPTVQPTKWNPTRYWSPFVMVVEGAGTATDATYQIAVTGSNLAVQAYALATQAEIDAQLALSQSGSAFTAGTDAYALASGVSGTATAALLAALHADETANGAYEIAVSGTLASAQALSIATTGTNLASAAYVYAGEAYAIAVAGTNAASAAQITATAGSNLAEQAYLLALAGGSPSAVAQSAYTIAIAGTNAASAAQSTADLALHIAQIGTDVGTNAYNIAVSGSNLAQQAYVLALAGGSTSAVAQDAYTIAVAGTNAAAAAQNTATSGSNIAVQAYLLALSGGSASALAQSAYDLAVIGTNVGTNAYTVAVSGSNLAQQASTSAQSAYALAVIGTNAAEDAQISAGAAQSTANAAYALAQIGTTIPPLSTLPDVNIPAPTAQQVLIFDGSQWIAGDSPSTGATGAFTFFLDEAPSGTLGYQTLLTFPSSGTEEMDSVSVVAGAGLQQSTSFLSSYLNRTRIDAGIWEFDVYGSVDTASAYFVISVLTVGNNGAESELFRVTTPEYSTSTPTLTTTLSFQGSFPAQLTDKLLARFYGTTTSAAPVLASFYHNGTEHYTHFHTPLFTEHNNLAGLQGGSSNQFYHTTLDQNNALVGSSGLPSATNVFVTQTSLTTEQGTRSSKDQDLQNQVTSAQSTASSAQNTANVAQSIATTGLTTAWVGTSAASGAQATANAAQGIATTALNTAWAGTSTGSVALNSSITAVNTAWAGTSQAGSAQNIATQAYNLAVIGTNAAAGSDATARATATQALTTADQALVTSWVGTDAYTLANLALQTAWTGTNNVNVLAVQVFM